MRRRSMTRSSCSLPPLGSSAPVFLVVVSSSEVYQGTWPGKEVVRWSEPWIWNLEAGTRNPEGPALQLRPKPAGTRDCRSVIPYWDLEPAGTSTHSCVSLRSDENTSFLAPRQDKSLGLEAEGWRQGPRPGGRYPEPGGRNLEAGSWSNLFMEYVSPTRSKERSEEFIDSRGSTPTLLLDRTLLPIEEEPRVGSNLSFILKTRNKKKEGKRKETWKLHQNPTPGPEPQNGQAYDMPPFKNTWKIFDKIWHQPRIHMKIQIQRSSLTSGETAKALSFTIFDKNQWFKKILLGPGLPEGNRSSSGFRVRLRPERNPG
ncbi:hypothetical protein DY000_02014595 [Brassica cretica]|uniref:Uncharacterized protein n=1 Tax=Brassica cretica TaxID=69181 RepID=A0ABQ7CVP0_BRACR|nr:hypothetical protein DY000_02014595 [Brassica cretica]